MDHDSFKVLGVTQVVHPQFDLIFGPLAEAGGLDCHLFAAAGDI